MIIFALALSHAEISGAATVEDTSGILTITSGPEDENFVVSVESGKIVVESSTGLATASCDSPDVTRVECPLRPAIVADLGGGVDEADFTGATPGIQVEAHGGYGADQLTGGPLHDQLYGDEDGDRISGGGGHDQITGGAGADELRGEAGDDTLNSNDGAADALLDCGEGSDGLNRDVFTIDSDAVIVGCETVSPATPPDGDGDGVPDGSDGCPAQAGPPSNGGCPVSNPPAELDLGKAILNKKKGTAKLPVSVDLAGVLRISGKGLRKGFVTTGGPGIFNLPVKPKGRLEDKLERTGKASAGVTVTFTPSGGEPVAESLDVRLKQN